MKPSTTRLLICLVVPPVTGVTLGYAAVFFYLNVAGSSQPMPSIRFSIPAYLVTILLVFTITLLPSLLLAFVYERFLFDEERGSSPARMVYAITVPFGTLLGVLLVLLTSSQSVTLFLVMMMVLGGVMGAVTGWAALRVSRGKRSEKGTDVHSSTERLS